MYHVNTIICQWFSEFICDDVEIYPLQNQQQKQTTKNLRALAIHQSTSKWTRVVIARES